MVISRSIRIASVFFVFLVFLGSYFLLRVPDVEKLKGCVTTSLHKINLCPGRSNYSQIQTISPSLRHAIVISEDAAFFTHGGFDFFEIKKSIGKNLKTGGFARGASTITQQLAKNVFLSSEKTIARKVLEALITMRLEKYFSKAQILERYLNVVEFGPGIYGVKQAASYYFNKAPSELNVLESSFLAFLLPSPKIYSQSFRDGSLSPFARKSIVRILRKLRRFGRIADYEYIWANNYIDSFPWKEIPGPETAFQSGTLEESGPMFEPDDDEDLDLPEEELREEEKASEVSEDDSKDVETGAERL